MTKFETLLVRGFVNFYMQYATRDEVRKFNEALTTFKYLSFYPYGVNMSNLRNLMFIAFSDNNDIVQLEDNITISDCVAQDTNYHFYLLSRIATVMDRHYIISTKDINNYIEPLSIEKIQLEKFVYNQPVIREVPKNILHKSVLCYIFKNEEYQGYEFEDDVRFTNFYKSDTRITVNLVHDFVEEPVNKHGFDRIYNHRNYTVSFNSLIIGFITETGSDYQKRNIYCTNPTVWKEMMQYVEKTINFNSDEIFGVTVVDAEADCDILVGIPGLTGSLAVYTKEPWKN